MFKIDTLVDHQRMSTQDLLLAIEAAVQDGETEFEIAASCQHDIGGPLWHPEGKKLTFYVTNPGQRVGLLLCFWKNDRRNQREVVAWVELLAGTRIVARGV